MWTQFPDLDAARSTKAVKLSISLSLAGGDTAGVLRTIEEALNAIAQGIESLVDGMLYFPGCSAGDRGFATAFLNVVADGFAVVALVTGQ